MLNRLESAGLAVPGPDQSGTRENLEKELRRGDISSSSSIEFVTRTEEVGTFMAFCAQCGAEATGNFCPRCGATMNISGAGSQGAYVPPQSATTSASSAGMSENVASALCYLLGLVTGIIFLVLAPYNQNRTVRFHAFQAIFFHVGVIVLWIGWTIINVTFAAITHGFSGFITLPVSLLLGLGFFILWLYLMYSAYNNKLVVLPVVGPLAQKQV